MSLLTAWPVKIYLYPAVEETLFYLNKTIYINTTIYKYQKLNSREFQNDIPYVSLEYNQWCIHV